MNQGMEPDPQDLDEEADISEEEFERLESSQSPDILRGVQHKLHQRSGGRFYRDRFSRMQSTTITLWISAVVIVGACVLWLLLD